MKSWLLALVGVFAAIVVVALVVSRLFAPPPRPEEPPTAADNGTAPTVEVPHITATLFFGSADGQSLVPVRSSVAFASDVVEQGRQIVTAQLAQAPNSPLVSVIPPGTTLRAFYVTEKGDAFVDLSPDVVSAHPGGSLNELLTVYALVGAVTANLPVVKRVQILVDGKEVDTLAGHVDLRRPLVADPSLIRDQGGQ